MKPTEPDLIFSKKQSQIKDFTFDAQVVEVFPDMISRSVPGYKTIIDTIIRIRVDKLYKTSLCTDISL